MGDIAQIIQELREPVERYVARFRTIRNKYIIMMTESDYARLVQDRLLWLLKKHFLVTRFIDLFNLSSKVNNYKRARAL